MTKNNENTVNNEAIEDMTAIINFTYYCDEVLKQAQRGLLNGLEATGAVLGYRRAVNEVLCNDILGFVYDKFTVALLGDTKDREVAKEYFRTTTKLYKDAGGFK